MGATFEFGGRAIQDRSGYSIFKWVGNQYRPEGTWEQWPGDYYGAGQHDGAQDEGHFYMECSNRGICDRKSGECECFDGYTGVGCSRLSCPESCSGHGTCETVDELRQQNPAWQQFSVETYKDSAELYAEISANSNDGTNVVLLEANDYIKIGHHPPMKISAVAGTKITLYSEFPETLPYGSRAWKVFKYDLWDATKNRACKCDPLWTGNDCSLRKCPFGDDPLTVVSYDPESEGTLGTNFMNTGTSSRPLQHTRFMLVIRRTAKKQSDKRWRSILSIVQTVVHSVLRLPMNMVMSGQQDQSHWLFGCRRHFLQPMVVGRSS